MDFCRLALTSRGRYKTSVETGRSLPRLGEAPRPVQALRDNFLQTSGDTEKSIGEV